MIIAVIAVSFNVSMCQCMKNSTNVVFSIVVCVKHHVDPIELECKC